MPYVYMDELPDGMEEAIVHSEEDYNGVTAQLEKVQAENTELAIERDNLAKELDAAKTKFANAFLSSPQHAKQVQKQEAKGEDMPSTFDTLFKGRNNHNAN